MYILVDRQLFILGIMLVIDGVFLLEIKSLYSITHKMRLPPLHSDVVWSLTNSCAWVKFIYIEWLEFKTTSNCIVNTCCGISYSLAFLVCSEILTTVTRVQTRFREYPRQLLVWNEEAAVSPINDTNLYNCSCTFQTLLLFLH